jgi:ribosomal protein L37E
MVTTTPSDAGPEGGRQVVFEPHNAPSLGLAEAYHVANRWLAHAGTPARSIEEPVDGVVELLGPGFHARVRIGATPLPQGAVLAVLRTAGPTTQQRLLLFSVTGYTTGALVFADTQGVALFDISGDGDVVPCNTHARALMPAEPLAPAFAAPVEPEVADEPEPDPEETADEEPVVWRDCHRCGATHHPRANFCASCGADLHTRLTMLGSDQGSARPSPSKLDSRGHSAATSLSSQQPVPPPRPGAPTLRCRTCGSHDIDLIYPHH